MKTLKKIGTIMNGDVIEFNDNKVTVSGIWNNTRVQLCDNDGNPIHSYYLVGRGGAFNGTLYDARIMQDTQHPAFS